MKKRIVSYYQWIYSFTERSIILKWFIIPLSLLFLWVVFSLLINPYYSFSVLIQHHETEAFVETKIGELKKGEKISGQFTALYNNLGIIALPFNNFDRINTDTIIFRVKDVNEKKWHYENKYNVDVFKANFYYPFGFPSIQSSKGHTYYFEFESLRGRVNDSIGLTTKDLQFNALYKYPKSQVLSSRDSMISFMTARFQNLFLIDAFQSRIYYLFPFLYYLFWRLIKKPILSKNYFIQRIVTLGLVGAIFMAHSIKSDFPLFFVLGCWVISCWRLSLKGIISFGYALLFFILAVVAVALQKPAIADYSFVLTYLLLIVGLIQEVFEGEIQPNLSSLSEYFKSLLFISKR